MSKKLLSILPLILFLLLVSSVGYLVVGGSQADAPTPTSTEKISTASAALEPSPTHTPAVVPSNTPAPTGTATSNATGTPTPTYTPLATPTPFPPTSTPTPSPSPTPTPTAAHTPTLAPPATPTPATTPTPTLYPSPVLDEPVDSVISEGRLPPLSWNWGRELAEDEYFEVRIWHDGDPYHAGIVWVKRSPFDFNLKGFPTGKYFWSIAVMRGNVKSKGWLGLDAWEGIDPVIQLSEESEIRSFSLSINDDNGCKPPFCP